MKFWQKTFLILNIIFIIFIDSTILIIAQVSYKRQLESYEDKAAGEAYFIANSIHKDFSLFYESEELSTSNEEKTFQSYSNYYKQQGVRLAMKEGSAWKYCDERNFFASVKDVATDASAMSLWISEKENEKYIMVQVQLKKPFDHYTLCYSYYLSNFTKDWEYMTFYFVLAGISITIILSVILYFVLRKLTKPIYELNHATKEIMNGNYQKRVRVSGKDELAELGKYFNLMSDKVEHNIEDLKEEMQRKQRLVDNLAHELRTPLTAISGYAEYMQVAKIDEDERYQALNYIRSETKQLEKLSQVLLLLADIRETKIPMENIVIKKLITSIEQRFAKNMSEKNIHLDYHEFAESIYGNYELLEILLSNLIENALRAIKQNGKIEITSYIEDSKIILTIADNGIGMEQEDLLHIMEPFYRVDKARSRKHGGVGLGTALCAQIVNRHQATIQYESAIHMGTTVKLEFIKGRGFCHNVMSRGN